MKSDKFLLEEYYLIESPFADTIASNKWLDTWTNRVRELETWKKFIKDAKRGQVNQMAFLIGEYGRGKTLSLLKIYREALDVEEILPIYMNFHSEQRPKNAGLDLMFKILKSIIDTIKECTINQNKLIHSIGKIPEYLNEPKEILKAILIDKGQENKKLAEYFLAGQIRLNKTELRQLGILRKIDDIEIAKEYLAAILILLNNVGYTGVFFVIDEFEYLFSLIPKSQRTIYIALLRGLYDFPIGVKHKVTQIAKLNFFIAISEGGWNALQEMESQERGQGGPIQPLMRRVTLKSNLLPFTKKETRELIENRLSIDRVKKTRQSKPLIPFTNDFVDFVFEKAEGEIWKTIKICSQVLDVGIERGVSMLNRPFAEKAYKERNL